MELVLLHRGRLLCARAADDRLGERRFLNTTVEPSVASRNHGGGLPLTLTQVSVPQLTAGTDMDGQQCGTKAHVFQALHHHHHPHLQLSHFSLNPNV